MADRPTRSRATLTIEVKVAVDYEPCAGALGWAATQALRDFRGVGPTTGCSLQHGAYAWQVVGARISDQEAMSQKPKENHP